MGEDASKSLCLSPAERLAIGPTTEALDTSPWPMKLDAERCWSEDFARLERDGLWPRRWQIACRESEVPSLDDCLGDAWELLAPYRMEELIPLGFNLSQWSA
ncbi:hypothetical protein [Sphingobium sp. EM0848]|uniref:hypothetical protein n=1 Tax=Sphingobium sp. EM0848 TaxID=2743473 RepID=UPI00159BF4E2|nr:hypothetical protein [Sphingobium sp. EM0848]